MQLLTCNGTGSLRRSYMKFMKKYLFGIIVALVVIPVAWYLISPIWRVQELEEASPLAHVPPPTQGTPPFVSENLPEAMSPETKEQFTVDMEKAQEVSPKVMS